MGTALSYRSTLSLAEMLSTQALFARRERELARELGGAPPSADVLFLEDFARDSSAGILGP